MYILKETNYLNTHLKNSDLRYINQSQQSEYTGQITKKTYNQNMKVQFIYIDVALYTIYCH